MLPGVDSAVREDLISLMLASENPWAGLKKSCLACAHAGGTLSSSSVQMRVDGAASSPSERSGVYWKPKGAAAERAGPRSILPHQIPVKLGDRCRAVDFEGVWDKCCDTICHTLSNSINAKAKMPERSLNCYVRIWTPAHIHLCNIDTHTYTRCVSASALTHA